MRTRGGVELRAAAFLAAAAAALFLPWWLRGLSPFWGDMTYLHQPWRAAPAQLIQAGRLPLWEPSLYLGMPMAASMQGGLFYPPGLFFYFFGFARAAAFFQSLHVFLAAWLCALWLRSLRLSWGAACAGALSLSLGGLMISRLPFLNHLGALAWLPALALLFDRPVALGAALALMFLAGYPSFVVGGAAIAWALALALGRGRRVPAPRAAGCWLFAAALAAGLSAAQLLPALELVAHSRRAAGVGLEEALRWSFSPRDLLQWISPLAVPLSRFRPAADWWKCVYMGLLPFLAAAAGLRFLPRRRALALAGFVAVAFLLVLGNSNPVSRALWTRLPPLRYVRYPGNLAYLTCLPLAALVAAGFARWRHAPVLSAAAAASLLFWGWRSTPAAPRRLFTTPGPLVRALQARLGPTRYLLSPLALESSSGAGVFDWKQRLYGLTNAPYRLRAVSNFGEPLVPSANYAFMDRVLSASSAAEAAAWLPWAGASRLLTPKPAVVPGLAPEGRVLWFVSRVEAPVSDAYLLTPEQGARLPAELPERAPPPPARPLIVRRERADRFSVAGEGAGWAYVAEPRYPGWRVTLETPAGARPASPRPALGPFQEVEVPAGPWTLRWRYDPASWRWGVAVSLVSLLALGAGFLARVPRLSHVA